MHKITAPLYRPKCRSFRELRIRRSVPQASSKTCPCNNSDFTWKKIDTLDGRYFFSPRRTHRDGCKSRLFSRIRLDFSIAVGLLSAQACAAAPNLSIQGTRHRVFPRPHSWMPPARDVETGGAPLNINPPLASILPAKSVRITNARARRFDPLPVANVLVRTFGAPKARETRRPW